MNNDTRNSAVTSRISATQTVQQKGQENRYLDEIYKDICSHCQGYGTIEFQYPKYVEKNENIKYISHEVSCDICKE